MANLTSREIEDEIRDVMFIESAKYTDMEFILPNAASSSRDNGTDTVKAQEWKIKQDIRNLFYNECAVYKDIEYHDPKKPNELPTESRERVSSCRRKGRVENTCIPSVQEDLAVFDDDSVVHTRQIREGSRNRNLSEGSYFAPKSRMEIINEDEMCCDIDARKDRVCPGRLKSPHGRYSVDNITNMAAIKCLRWRMRRNALCDPLRMLLPQSVRERLERNTERRKASMVRKVSRFMTVNFDLDREEELI